MIDDLVNGVFAASNVEVVEAGCCGDCTCTCPCSPWSTVMSLSGPSAAPDATKHGLAGVINPY
jgi:hypothetical protein